MLPKIDLASKSLLDVRDITKILPHRAPLLMVDKIMELSAESVVGVKNVTMTEFWTGGHFPDEPIMPGVLIIEAIVIYTTLKFSSKVAMNSKRKNYISIIIFSLLLSKGLFIFQE